MDIIEIQGVSKSFGRRTVINNFSCRIPAKTIVALVGPSGCGKSTILNMIGLLETIDSGTIKIKGQVLPHINSSSATLLRRHTINYLFQSYALINNITVQENLLVAMEFVRLSPQKKILEIKQVLKKLQIDHLLKQPVHTLSGGEQQRVALARCILKPGDIILADEPTGSLDPVMTQKVFQMIQTLRDEYGKTIIIVTHDMNLAKQTDYIVDLSDLK